MAIHAGNISGSSTSTGSFGHVVIDGTSIFGDGNGNHLGVGGVHPPGTIDGWNGSGNITILNVQDLDHAHGARVAIQGSDASLDLVDTGASGNKRWFTIYNQDDMAYMRGLNSAGSAVTHEFISFDLDTGYLGINDDSPSYQLDVAGTGRFTGALTLDSTISNISTTHVTASGNISGSATSTGSFGSVHTAGKVGIGTTNPGGGSGWYNLDVRGWITATTDADDTAGIHLNRSGGPSSGWNSTGGTWAIYRYGSGTYAGDSFHIGVAGVNEPFTILPGGNVGIGTTSPTSKLEIARLNDIPALTITRADSSMADGDEIGDIAFKMIDADYSTDGDIAARIRAVAGETHDGAEFGADLGFYTATLGSSGLNASLYIKATDTSANVGIGTASPDAPLHVAGAIKAEYIGAGAELLKMKYGGSGEQIFITSLGGQDGIAFDGYNGSAWATDILVIKETGNIGIGTGAPSQTLTVAGNISGSGTLNIDGTATFAGNVSATSKSFLIDHPTKPEKKLEHGSLEGPENGVYVRGKVMNDNVIELPEYWTGLVDEDTITVQLTSIGKFMKLYVKEIKDNKVYVEKSGFGKPSFFYNVYGERKDIDKMIVEY